jgi:phage tail-like protein
MALSPFQILFIGDFFDDDPSTVGVADADLLTSSFFEDTVGDPVIAPTIPTEGPAPIPPPPCPTAELYDFLPEIVRNNDLDGALKAVIEGVEAETCLYRNDTFVLTQLIDPMQAPDEVLPHLAATFDIRDFDADTNKMLLRHQIATAVETYKLKGTVEGVQLALLFMGWLSEVIELYEPFNDVSPIYERIGTAYQRNPGPGRRPASAILILVKSLVRGLRFTTEERAKIETRLGTTLPIHVQIAEIGRFECPFDNVGIVDELNFEFEFPFSEPISIVEFFSVVVRFLFDDPIALTDGLNVVSSDVTVTFWDVSPQFTWDSGDDWDGGSVTIRTV